MKNQEAIVDKFGSLKVWGRGEERAPHKPLLVLLALAECRPGGRRLIPFIEIEPRLIRLLEDFGPARRSFKAEYPFWRLTNDGFWEIPQKSEITVNSSGDPSKSELIGKGVCGGFTEEIFTILSTDQFLVSKLAKELLEKHFPESCHEDILMAAGLDFADADEQTALAPGRKLRDPDFRNKILTVYQYRCAVCGFDMKLGNISVCLEAAHIKWHQAGGPAIEQNGIALCSMHHKMFDRGVFAIDEAFNIKVSLHANGSNGVEEWLHRFAGQKLQLPRSSDFFPAASFTRWHVKEVFKGYNS